jgi:16S rRNA (adenine1518-N6/adenine1519-N6)-dimethyltransferase
MNLGEVRRIKDILKMFGARPNSDLGQNFLIEKKYLETILEAAEPLSDAKVLEVGPGMGVLTRELSRKAEEVIAVEVDPRMVEIVKMACLKCTNLTVKTQDIRKFDPSDLGDYKVVANLPYYLTSFILRKFLEEKNKPKEMVILIQKEVAQKVTAAPPKMSLLSISVQFYGSPKLIEIVPRDAFYPTPQVDSAILKISTYRTPIFPDVVPEKFFNLVRAGFSEKRKMLSNSLSSYSPYLKDELEKRIRAAGIDPDRRAETLTLEDWYRLYQTYYR